MTVGDLVDRWLETKASTVDGNTEYRWAAEHYVKPTFGGRKVR